MKHVQVGMTIKTSRVTGEVIEKFDGKTRGWRDTEYYRVRVTLPAAVAGEIFLVRLDEIRRAT